MNKNAMFLLKCVFRYSANAASKESARMVLFRQAKRPQLDEEIAALGRYHGDFITACLTGDVIHAWMKGDQHNRLAIELGMKNLFNDSNWIWCEGLDPKEFEIVKEAK